MTAYKHYFIVGTNDNALHDTMNGNVTGELIRCKDCKHWYRDADTGMACEFTNLGQPEEGFCNWAEKSLKKRQIK